MVPSVSILRSDGEFVVSYLGHVICHDQRMSFFLAGVSSDNTYFLVFLVVPFVARSIVWTRDGHLIIL